MTTPTRLRVASILPLLALAGCGNSAESTDSATGASTNASPSAPIPLPDPSPVGVPPTPEPAAVATPVLPIPADVAPASPADVTPAGPPAVMPAPIDVPDPVVPNPVVPNPAIEDPASMMDPTPVDPGVVDPTPVDPGVVDPMPEDPGVVDPMPEGNAGGGEWGLAENPGAGCSVPDMPSVDSLSADPKLPDPFTKMDGSSITEKSEWRCRREEILQQAYEFIYGDKPVPEASAVSGTVSTGDITVDVTDAGGSTSFSVSVDMNGASAPAPAIISYGAGAPVPSGVASISFRAIETTGGSGSKSGPFYDVYGEDHPAGYMVAQAWQISRILDVLEQDPSVIDPTKVGLTGCSRNGKGAFVGGVLDNRIALTIPVESGLGGTIGLRLVEVIDSYSGSEWPYHGISYVRWLSDVALGPFASGNSAGADDTDKLPIDMHEMMGLIAPRGLYIVDNPSTMYNGLDRNSAWVTANVGKRIFEALGVGDHMAYEGASGGHCSWRSQYDPSLNAMIDKFLKGNDSASTGNFNTDLPNPPNPEDHYDWDVPTLSGDL